MKMINIFSICIGIILFAEVLLLVALLKPVRDPSCIRDFWAKFQERCISQTKVLISLFSFLLLNTAMEIAWENQHHNEILQQVSNSGLVLEFYSSKISLCYTCFLMAVYILLLIERLTAFLLRIARLLEFELMCRHAILTRDNATQMSNATIVTCSHIHPEHRFIQLLLSLSANENNNQKKVALKEY